jgi:hypothetical protein
LSAALLLITFTLLQNQPGRESVPGDRSCSPEARRHMTAAAARGEAWDLSGAIGQYLTASALGCAEAELASQYLQGLAAAREAYRYGGSPQSLAPVKVASAALERGSNADAGLARIARLVLQAAAAAAQSERDEMALLLDQAIRLEALQIEAGQPPLPVVSAHEAAGDLWLQVHGYEEARRAYLEAAERLGARARITLGLARVAVRQKDTVAACTHYRELAARWSRGAEGAPELAEARAVFEQPPCVPRGGGSGRQPGR